MSTQLYAPASYWQIPPRERRIRYNGAGPKGYGWLVPDTLWGLSITDAANIHDHMYGEGKNLKDKEEADRVFLNNMVRIIEAETESWIFKWLRMRRANKYFWAVSTFGGPAFWANKNQPSTMGVVQ